MTVEFAVGLPVLLAVALVAFNALVYLGDCAAFDRQARQAVCTFASAPSYGEGTGAVAGHVSSQLQGAFAAANERVSVQASGMALGYVRYTAKLEYRPTLFGRAMAGSAFGVSFPPLVHQTTMVVDPYRPGAVI